MLKFSYLPPIPEFTLRLADEFTLEADIQHHQSINALFDALSEHNIHIHSMRNKTNRLEELFMRLISREPS